MASPQCLGYSRYRTVTRNLCFPPKEDILNRTEEAVKNLGAKAVFVATDYDPMLTELNSRLKGLNVSWCWVYVERGVFPREVGGGGGWGGVWSGQLLEVWVGVKGAPLRPSKACPCLRQECHFATLFKKKDHVHRIWKCFVLRPA